MQNFLPKIFSKKAIKYRGNAFKFCQNSSPSDALFEEWNNRISSIKFNTNATIQVFSEKNFSGKSKTLSQSIPNLKDRSLGMNDAISSIRFISPGPAGLLTQPTVLDPTNNLSRGEKV